MSLIVSVSGIRGTIGGASGENLTPRDVMAFCLAYGHLLKTKHPRPRVCIGRDARISGPMMASISQAVLSSIGIDVLDLGLTTTPTIEMAVMHHKAQGGIMLTASHNPMEWNALKLLNERGEFISPEEGVLIQRMCSDEAIYKQFVLVEELGTTQLLQGTIEEHVNSILNLPYIPVDMIRAARFKVVADCINSTGALALPVLFEALGCDYKLINEKPDGRFAHNPEPLEGHLGDLIRISKEFGSDLGIAVDPDVDRLALVDEKGRYIGEEYTLVTAADFMLSKKGGPVVSNLSSSRALRDLASSYATECYYSPVGEAHVVHKMKEVAAVIGGEGNGGVILPGLHYGRDALAGIALVLANMVHKGKTLSQLRDSYSNYVMVKDKIQLKSSTHYEDILSILMQKYHNEQINTEDGLKIDFEEGWVHLRKSNTEPIIRIYSEALATEGAVSLVQRIKKDIAGFI